jgi:hypothetical protein
VDCYEMGDTLHGSKIYAEARKVDGPRVIVKTGRHRAQSITLIENAKAVIIRKLKYVYKEEDNSENSP